MKARKSGESLDQNLPETIAQSVDEMILFLPDREKSGFFKNNLDIYNSLYNRVPLIYLTQLCLVFEKK